jgi:hypothetical protein
MELKHRCKRVARDWAESESLDRTVIAGEDDDPFPSAETRKMQIHVKVKRVAASCSSARFRHKCLSLGEKSRPVNCDAAHHKFPDAGTSSDGARRIRTADLLGAIQALCGMGSCSHCRASDRITP